MSTNIKAPDGMNRVDFFQSLWTCSTGRVKYEFYPNGEALRKKVEGGAFKNKEKVREMLRSNPSVGFYAGRCVYTDFSKYPHVDLNGFQRSCALIPMQAIMKRCFNANRSENQ